MLKAVDELLGQPREEPVPDLCGTSAGAINAAALAIHADNFAEAVRHLLGVWENFRVAPCLPLRLAGHHAQRPALARRR